MAVRTPTVQRDRPSGLDSVGTVNTVTGLTVKECGVGPLRQTVFTFDSVEVTVGNTTGASFGSLKLYDFPEGNLAILGAIANFTVIDWNGQIAATGSGDFSLGSTATADATLSSTDVDIMPSSAMLDPFVGGIGTGTGRNTAAAFLNGSVTPVDLYLNVIVDDADVGDTDTDLIQFTGTIVVTWMNLGD